MTTRNDLQYTIRMHGGCGHEFLPYTYCTRDANTPHDHAVHVGEQEVRCVHGKVVENGVNNCEQCALDRFQQDIEYDIARKMGYIVIALIALILLVHFSGS